MLEQRVVLPTPGNANADQRDEVKLLLLAALVGDDLLESFDLDVSELSRVIYDKDEIHATHDEAVHNVASGWSVGVSPTVLTLYGLARHCVGPTALESRSADWPFTLLSLLGCAVRKP